MRYFFCSPYQSAYAFHPLMDMMAVANRRHRALSAHAKRRAVISATSCFKLMTWLMK